MVGMARPLRIEYAGAVYRVMARGNYYTRVAQAVRQMKRNSGKKLEKLKRQLLKRRKGCLKTKNVTFLGLTLLWFSIEASLEARAIGK